MKPQKLRRKITTIQNSRWVAYAAAGTASAFGGIYSAEAEIHYSGIINAKFSGEKTGTFPLLSINRLQFSHSINYYSSGNKDGGNAFFHILAFGGSIAGFSTSCAYGVASVSNLNRSDAISERAFVPDGGVLATADRANCYGNARGQFIPAGFGLIGFKFNTGSGDQYGWARIETLGYPRNQFRLVDYAYGDPGDRVRAGEKSGGHAPALGSLGGLALGAAGLLAWRRRRRASR